MKRILYTLLFTICFGTTFAQNIYFPDNTFKRRLINTSPNSYIAKNLQGNYFKVDANNDEEISVSEALEVSYLNFLSDNIYNLSGIEYFTNLKYFKFISTEVTSFNTQGLEQLDTLICSRNYITNLDVHNLTNLKYLDCMDNEISEINVQGLTGLQTLICENNYITSLNLQGLSSLQTLNCATNQISSIDLSGLVNLQYLYLFRNQFTSLSLNQLVNLKYLYLNLNQITSLDLQGLTNLEILSCEDNQITFLDLKWCPNLTHVYCNSNQLTSIDASSLTHLLYLYCLNNYLSYINIKNGSNEDRIFASNPSLQYICCDVSEISSVKNLMQQYGYTNCIVNSYCSHAPGGNYNTIRGNIKFDFDNNGCDDNDLNVSNILLNNSDNDNFGSTITDVNGNYTFYTDSLNVTLSPILSNPFISILPSLASISFPDDNNHVINQDFCITQIGPRDVEVRLIPVTNARPGFNASYKLVYTNKGNQIMYGNVTFDFNDDLMDYVSANPTPNIINTGLLSWDYAGLMPFESREIALTMRIHSPSNTLPVNRGDILGMQAIIYPIAGDETLNDNQSELKQLVINSYDPNDKTCVQGDRIDITKVGDYLDYVIRFENTGTAEAVNIVVADTIDTNMFDINSLVPISGSHTFVTRIKDNKVEFIFENINLPFDDANNDGYVAFKIKTKPTLTLGTNIQNRAAIYFDFNFPIITNRTSTVVSNLTNVENINNHVFVQITPNPAKDLIQIQSSEIVETIEIQDVSGKIIQKTLSKSDTKTMNIAHLQKGLYFLKLNTAKGFKVVRLVKE